MIKKLKECYIDTQHSKKSGKKSEQETTNNVNYNDNSSEANSKKREVPKAFVGAAIHSTRGVVVAAPMAAYLVKNTCSRFMFSHNFNVFPFNVFHDEENSSCTVKMTNIDGELKPHLSCSAWNYTHRPKSLKHLCAYKFYSLCETNKQK